MIAPAEPCDIVLFEKLAQIGYKNCLVWSRNNGLYFKPAIQAALATHLVKPRLRDNTPDKLRHALRWIVSTLGQPTPFAQNVFSLFFSAPGEKAMRAAAITIPDDRMLTLTSNLTEMRVSPTEERPASPKNTFFTTNRRRKSLDTPENTRTKLKKEDAEKEISAGLH